MEIPDIKQVEKVIGVASTVRMEDLVTSYAEGVKRFLRDGEIKFGDGWVRGSASKLYGFNRNEEGDVIGSSTYMGVAVATFCPEIPLITGRQLKGLYENGGNKNPFGDVFINFGVKIHGRPEKNTPQAKSLLGEFDKRGIKVGKGRVLDFNQLRLDVNEGGDLVYRLSDDVLENNVANISNYPFILAFTSKNGLFGACLRDNNRWSADTGNLSYVDAVSRMVRYDAEEVIRQEQRRGHLAERLTEEFVSKFK